MGRFAKEPAGSFQQAPPGTHLAVCHRIIDLGHQHTEYQGKALVREQIAIQFELPEELMDDGRPFGATVFLTNSLSEKAKLRRFLESWRGRAFTAEELGGFDLGQILGKACLLSIILGENGKSKVQGVSALPKGMKAPAPVNPVSTFFLDEWSDEGFAALPKGFQEIIRRSDEYQASHAGAAGADHDPGWPADGNPPADDDIPF